MNWINKDTEIYCSFAKQAGNTGCQMMNTAFYYYGLNKIYKSFSVDNIEDAVNSVKTLGIKGFAITMPYKIEVLKYVDELDDSVKNIQSANTVINDNGKLIAYNTDYYAAKTMLSEINFLNGYPKIFILGNGGYSKAVQQAVKDLNLDYTLITRDNWDMIGDIINKDRAISPREDFTFQRAGNAGTLSAVDTVTFGKTVNQNTKNTNTQTKSTKCQ